MLTPKSPKKISGEGALHPPRRLWRLDLARAFGARPCPPTSIPGSTYAGILFVGILPVGTVPVRTVPVGPVPCTRCDVLKRKNISASMKMLKRDCRCNIVY